MIFCSNSPRFGYIFSPHAALPLPELLGAVAVRLGWLSFPFLPPLLFSVSTWQKGLVHRDITRTEETVPE